MAFMALRDSGGLIRFEAAPLGAANHHVGRKDAVLERTDAEGRFVLPQVPPGRYEIVCWLPNWHVDHFENDPELFIYEGPARLAFRPAVEKRQKVVVIANQSVDVSFSFSAADFDTGTHRR